MYIENLKKIRQKNNLKQDDIAKTLDIKQQQYQLYESGKRDLPVKHLIKLAEIYDTSTDEILGINKKNREEINT